MSAPDRDWVMAVAREAARVERGSHVGAATAIVRVNGRRAAKGLRTWSGRDVLALYGQPGDGVDQAFARLALEEAEQ